MLLVSDDAEVDGGVAVLLDGGQQGGAVGVSDLPWMKVVLWIQQLGNTVLEITSYQTDTTTSGQTMEQPLCFQFIVSIL